MTSALASDLIGVSPGVALNTPFRRPRLGPDALCEGLRRSRDVETIGPVEKSLKSQRASCTPSTAASELDRAWGRLRVDNRSAAYRERLPTPHDENPLRHDAPHSERRDRLPTLPEIDPLRHDLAP